MINQEGIKTEHIRGHRRSRRTLNNVMHKMSQSHFKSFEDLMTTAADRKWLIVLIIDDFTAIHTKRRPEEENIIRGKDNVHNSCYM